MNCLREITIFSNKYQSLTKTKTTKMGRGGGGDEGTMKQTHIQNTRGHFRFTFIQRKNGEEATKVGLYDWSEEEEEHLLH